jgi:hypothetical protein
VEASGGDACVRGEADAVGHGFRGSRKAATDREEELGGASGGGAC